MVTSRVQNYYAVGKKQLLNHTTNPVIMRVPEAVKQVLKKFSESTSKHEVPVTVPDPEDGYNILNTSMTSDNGPKPGKMGIIFYYISLTLCMVGILTLLKCSYIQVRFKSPSPFFI